MSADTFCVIRACKNKPWKKSAIEIAYTREYDNDNFVWHFKEYEDTHIMITMPFEDAIRLVYEFQGYHGFEGSGDVYFYFIHHVNNVSKFARIYRELCAQHKPSGE